MDTVTYSQTLAADFINSTLIPLRLEVGSSDWTEKFTIRWTPTLLVVNAELKEHHRTVGFLNSEELIASLLLGCAKSSYDGSQFADMAKPLNEILTTYPKSFAAPEAVFLRGVSNFLLSHDVTALKEIHQTISSDYPNSEWLMRAAPYKLL